MPTTLEWDFLGGEDGSALAARRGKQRVFFGDVVYDECFGKGNALRIEGSEIVIEFTDDLGEKEEKSRTKGHVYALTNRDERPQCTPVRKEKSQQGLMVLLRPDKRQPVDTPARKRQKAFGKSVKATPPNKTLAATPTATGTNAVVTETPLMLIGEQYADSSDSDEDGEKAASAARAREKAGKLCFRSLDGAEKAQYKHDKYEERKREKQEEITAGYRDTWLKKNGNNGWHCALCINASVKPADKLSVNGYGWVADGTERSLVPIPDRKKLEVCCLCA